MGELVSVIIPAYNAEADIENCIRTLLNQTYSRIEIIIVNDGSKDRTGELCDSIAVNCDNITVIHQENAGVSAARNAGLQTAKGKWIVFLDADDKMMPEAIEHALALAGENDCDTVCWNCYSECEGKLNEYPPIQPDKGLYKGSEMRTVLTEALYGTRSAQFYPGMMFRAVWGKLLAAEVIRANALTFPVGMPLGEDAIFLADYFQFCRKVMFVNCYWNHYKISNASAVGKYRPNLKELQMLELETMQKRLHTYEVDMDTMLLNQYLQFDYQFVHNLYKKGGSMLETYKVLLQYIQERQFQFENFSDYDKEKINKKSIPVAWAMVNGLSCAEALMCMLREWRHR